LSRWWLLACLVFVAGPVFAQDLDGDADSRVRSRLHLAGELLRDGRYADAVDLYREALESAPGDPRAQRGLKVCLLELKEYDELLEILQGELARSPGSPAILEELGTVAVRKGDRVAGLKWWRQILDVQEHSRGSYSSVADLLTRSRMLDEALEIYAEAEAKYPGQFTRQKAALHELRFEFEQATTEYLASLERSPTSLSYIEGKLLRIGEGEEGLGKVIDRVERWIAGLPARTTSVAELSTIDVVFRKLLGDLYLESGHHDRAREQYFALVEEAPTQLASLLVFGKRCQTDGEHEVAIRVFEHIVDTAPNVRAVPSALAEIGSCQTSLKRWDDAIATYERLIDEYPQTDFALAARFRLGRALLSGRRDFDRAEQVFRDLIAEPQGPWGEADPQFEVAECELRRGEVERARSIYAAIQQRPFQPETLERSVFEEARAQLYLGKFAEADTLFKSIATKYPRGLHVNDALEFSILINTNQDESEILNRYAQGLYHLRAEMPVEGAAVFESLIHDHPDAAISDDALLRLGIAYRRADQPKQALEALRLAVDQAQVPDLAAQARLLRGQILAEDFRDTASARKEYEELLVDFPETLAADRARDLLAVLTRTLP
jgi:tetratricopeptide (TPR) repeat protein